jgi:hypothetical protein
MSYFPTMSQFPFLKPAFTAHIHLDVAVDVGFLSKGHTLQIVPFAAGGFLRSEPN